jgi:predicted phosphodiesterase
LDEALAGHTETILAGGHTHVQLIRRHRASFLLNPGSVGLPHEITDSARNPGWAEYALVTTGDGGLAIELRRVPYDIGLLAQIAFDSGMPHAAWWAAD